MPELGEKIPVNDKVKNGLKTISEHLKDAEMAFMHASSWVRSEHDKLWDLIKEAHPDLLENYHVTYNHDTQELTVLVPKRKSDE